MINQGFYSATPTKLDINGPYMSFTSLPEGISGDPGDTVNLVGVATASFLGASVTTINDGSVAYKWYEVGVGALSDGNRLSGTNTNTLTIANLQSPEDSNRKFYLEAKYESAAYKNRLDGTNGNHIAPANSDPAAAEVEVPPVRASISASSRNISYDGSVTITWSTSNADTVTSNFGRIPKNGSKKFKNQTSSRRFRITASNSNGSLSKSVRVNVAAAPPPPPPPPAAPTINFAASSTNVSNGESVTLTWSTSNATSLTSNFDVTALNGSITITDLTQTKTFEITATGTGGTNQSSITVNVAALDPSIIITSQPSSESAIFNKCTGGGGSVDFSVGASVNDPNGSTLQYQWYLNGSALSNGTNISGVQSSTLTLKVLENQKGNNNVYVEVSYSGASTVQSNTVNYSVTVTNPTPSLSITSQPTNQSVFVGETATFSVGASISDGRPVSYQWYKNESAISGKTSSSLSITPSSAGSDSYYVIVSDSSTTCTAVPSSIESDTVTLTATVPQKIIRVGTRSSGSTSINYSDVNLSNFNFGSTANYEIYSPFEDIVVDVKIQGGAGSNKGSYSGGKGGQAIVRFTLRKNTEYIIRVLSGQGGAGGGTFIYEKAKLIACVGGGGGAGTGGNGGAGGGAGSAGGNGSGPGAGDGGNKSAASLGYFPGGDPYCNSASSQSIFGGLVSRCTIGDNSCSGPGFWQSNYSPCDNYGNSALNVNADPITGSALISRGFKDGIGHRVNGGSSQSSNEGSGGSGCEGGNAGTPNTRAGGGGGGGYKNGVSVVANKTGGRQSGTTGQFTISLPGLLSL